MCGLAGLLRLRGDQDLVEPLRQMSTRVAHRGPDGEGMWVDAPAGIGLAHRRLAVVDLSPTGNQPMLSSDGRWALAFNGEIYDHRSHRARLLDAGVRLRGSSDTEVLLEMISLQGVEQAVAAVDGMFALAAWDRRDEKLVLVRDRLGEKPLYYGRVGDHLAFASELTALRTLPGAPTEPDPQTLAGYLTFGFVPGPRSILPGIARVPPGTTLTLSRASPTSPPLPYWSIRDVALGGSASPRDDAGAMLVDHAELLLTQSVGRRLLADVPVGAFLSGGIDSSTIVALAAQASAAPVRTFTVAVGGDTDEADAAAKIAAHLGTDHTTIPLSGSAPLEMATQVATLYDEPFADPSAIPTVLVSQAARPHVTVCLTGDGADELLAGYNRYRLASGLLARSTAAPEAVRRTAASALSAVRPGAWNWLSAVVPGAPPALGDKARKAAGVLRSGDFVSAFAGLTQQWDPRDVLADPAGPSATSEPLPGSRLNHMLLHDQMSTLPDDMLVKVDRASMSVALEVRSPFLDHRFVEFTWALPEHAKLRRGRGKWLLRELLSRHVPPALWDRPKTGFDPPLADWLRGPLRAWAHDLLSPDRLRRQGLLRPEPIARALASHDSGRVNLDYPLWTVLMLQAWLDIDT